MPEDRKPRKALTLAEIEKAGLVQRGSVKDLVVTRLKTGLPGVDELLGGGIPYSRNTMLVGPESAGKTLLAQVIAARQQADENRSLVGLIDVERSYDPGWWAESGVDPDKLLVSQPATGEAAIEVICALLQVPEVGMVILDSIAMMTPAYIAEHSAEDGAPMASLAHVCSLMFQKELPLLNGKIFLMINQVRDGMGPYAEEVYPGGRSVRHNAHIILRVRRESWITENKQRVGYVMEIYSRKNKTAPPQLTCKLPMRFKGQFDMLTATVDEAVKRGLITLKGSFYTYEDQRIQGKQALYDYFRVNDEEFEYILKGTEDIQDDE